MTKPATQPASQTEADRLADQTAAMIAATQRRLAEAAAMPGLGSIRADRSIPIRTRRHSIRHKAIR